MGAGGSGSAWEGMTVAWLEPKRVVKRLTVAKCCGGNSEGTSKVQREQTLGEEVQSGAIRRGKATQKGNLGKDRRETERKTHIQYRNFPHSPLESHAC